MARRSELLAGDQGLQSLLAELHALRERVQMQHALLDVYANARAGAAPARKPIELWEPLAARSAMPAEGSESELDAAEVPELAGTVEAEAKPPPVPVGAAWWPVEERAAGPLVPNAGWGLYATAANVANAIGFSVCGLSAEQLQQAVDLIASVQREKRNFVPLFLTDSADLDVFRRHGFTVEYLAATPPAGTSPEAWLAYGRERREFLIGKWNLTRIVEFGPVTFGGDVRPKAADQGPLVLHPPEAPAAAEPQTDGPGPSPRFRKHAPAVRKQSPRRAAKAPAPGRKAKRPPPGTK